MDTRYVPPYRIGDGHGMRFNRPKHSHAGNRVLQGLRDGRVCRRISPRRPEVQKAIRVQVLIHNLINLPRVEEARCGGTQRRRRV